MATLVSYVPHYCPVPTENPEDLPLRAELFSTAQMAGYGRVLADAHEVGPRRRTHEHLLARLADNERVLRAVHYLLVLDVKAERRLTPAAEWLIDNFYVIEEQIRTASQHLPKNYSLELPRLLRGPSADLPRVYDIALGAVSHGDGRLDLDNLISFVTAYQTVTPLKLGELWAIPIMLRLALIENLRRVTARLAARRIDRNNAETWANMMVESATNDPKNLILIVADMARSDPPMVSSFVAELTRRLHGQGPALALPLTWIEQRLSESSQSIEYMVRSENQQQAADQVSMSNSIGSLRSLNATDWKAFVEQMSCVNQTLEDDPADVYSKMDFVTRDQYRHIVEKMARKASCAENDVASAAILLAKEGSLRRGISDRMAHVGYYLVDAGLPELGRVLRMRQTLGLAQTEMKHPASLVVYLGAIVLITLALTVWFGLKVQAEALPTWVMSLAVIPILLCASHVAVAVMNWGATLYSIPHALPRMDYSKGIPREARTLVIVPAMLLNSRNVENLLGDLEVRSQANRDTHLHFGLLTDLCDAPEETMPEDEALVQQAKQGIEALNLKYPRENRDMFFLFHRPRRWNERDQI